MKYERQINRLARMIWRGGIGVLYVNEKGPVARLRVTDDNDGTLVGVYTSVNIRRILSDIEATKASSGIPSRRYVRGNKA